MILITLISLFGIAIYNLSGTWCMTCTYDCPTCRLYWSSEFYILMFSSLSFLYYKFTRYFVLPGQRVICWIASGFYGLYVLYSIALLFSKDFNNFMSNIQSGLWQLIIVGYLMLSYVYLCFWLIRYEYDTD